MVRVLLRFPEKVVNQPITSQVILEQGVPVNILGVHVNQQGGEILADIPSSDAERVIEAFRERGVRVITRKLIEVDTEWCFDCGACISLCPVSAIKFNEDLSVIFDEEKCIGTSCGLCVDTCPARAIKLIR